MASLIRRRVARSFFLVAGVLGVAANATAAPPTLAEAYATLASRPFVDLTHDFAPGIPHWKGFGDEKRSTLYTIAKDGFVVTEYCHVGQWGTHVDAPAHFHAGLKTVDQIDPRDLLMPLVVLDVHEQSAKNADYVIGLDVVQEWEHRHGRIPAHAFVAMRTDWSKRWPDAAALANQGADGLFHYPGWSREVLKFLYENRQVAATGHETTDTDPGLATSKDDYSQESYLLGLNHYQIEMLANLDKVPEAGAIVMVSFPKPKDGSGFPARVIAILP